MKLPEKKEFNITGVSETSNEGLAQIRMAGFNACLDEVRKMNPPTPCEPNLGCATTRELIDEIRARIEVDGNLEYRTIDCDKDPSTIEIVGKD